MERSSQNERSKFDVKTKFVLVILGSVFTILFTHPFKLLILFFAILCLLVIMDIKAFAVLFRFRRLLSIFLTLVVLQNLFSPSGKTLIAIAGHPVISEGGLLKAFSGVLRVVNMLLLGVMIAVESPERITAALEELGVPHKLAMMVSVALLFLSVFRNEAMDMVTALKLRGIDIDSEPLKRRLMLYFRLAFPLTISALRKAQTMAAIIEVRGFGSELRQSKFSPFNNMKFWDVALISVFTIWGIAVWMGL